MPDSSVVPEPGFHLVLGHEGRILRSAPIRNAPRRHLQAPYLTPEVVGRLEEPLKELVLDVLGRDGSVLDSVGWPWIDEAFFERRPPTARDRSRGGRVKIFPAVRVLRIPVTQGGRFFLFSETDVPFLPDGTRPLTRRGLSLYSLVTPVPPPPPVPEFAGRLAVEPLPGPVPLPRPD
jgi:hypothetical protein